jgi:hypothetical protein
MKATATAKAASSVRAQKGRAPCENVEQEFSRRFLALLIAAYDPSAASDPLDFPPAKPPDAAEQRPRSLASRPSPFDASVWDIRLRKAAARRRAAAREAGDRVSAQLDFFAALTAGPAPDLSAAFLPEPAARPETPRYLANASADLAAEARARRERAAPPRPGDAAQRWQARIGRSGARRKAHAAQMRAYYARQGRAHREFLQGLGVEESEKQA